MKLRIGELQRVVKETVDVERTNRALRDELYKVFGPSVLVSERVERIAEVANEQMDVMEATGREPKVESAKLSVLLEGTRHKSSHVRKVVARLLPQKFAPKMVFDPSSSVRCAAATRCNYSIVKESLKRYPGDDQLATIARSLRLRESGVPTPKPVDGYFDLYGEEPLGDVVRTQSPLKDMPDTWYERTAHQLCKIYGTNLEGQWEEILATRVAASHFATSGVKVDRDKLLRAIYDCLEEREELVLGEGSLSRVAQRLRESSHLDGPAMPIIEEEVDPIAQILESNVSSAQCIDAAEKLFSIRKSSVPAGVKKYRLGEGRLGETLVPVKGSLPGGKIDSRVESALDRYVECWNKQQALAGEPYKLTWYPHPSDGRSVGFNLELK